MNMTVSAECRGGVGRGNIIFKDDVGPYLAAYWFIFYFKYSICMLF